MDTSWLRMKGHSTSSIYGGLAFVASLREFAQGNVLAMGQGKAQGNDRHESDQPQQNSATGGKLGALGQVGRSRADAEHVQQDSDCSQLRAAADHGELQHSSGNAGGHEQDGIGKSESAKLMRMVGMDDQLVGDGYQHPDGKRNSRESEKSGQRM